MKAFSTSGTARSRYVSSKEPVKNDKGGGSQGICICPHPSTMLLLLSRDDEEAFNKYRTKSLASSFRRFPSSSSSAEITVAANDDARNGDALLIASRRFLPPDFQLSRDATSGSVFRPSRRRCSTPDDDGTRREFVRNKLHIRDYSFIQPAPKVKVPSETHSRSLRYSSLSSRSNRVSVRACVCVCVFLSINIPSLCRALKSSYFFPASSF